MRVSGDSHFVHVYLFEIAVRAMQPVQCRTVADGYSGRVRKSPLTVARVRWLAIIALAVLHCSAITLLDRSTIATLVSKVNKRSSEHEYAANMSMGMARSGMLLSHRTMMSRTSLLDRSIVSRPPVRVHMLRVMDLFSALFVFNEWALFEHVYCILGALVTLPQLSDLRTTAVCMNEAASVAIVGEGDSHTRGQHKLQQLNNEREMVPNRTNQYASSTSDVYFNYLRVDPDASQSNAVPTVTVLCSAVVPFAYGTATMRECANEIHLLWSAYAFLWRTNRVLLMESMDVPFVEAVRETADYIGALYLSVLKTGRPAESGLVSESTSGDDMSASSSSVEDVSSTGGGGAMSESAMNKTTEDESTSLVTGGGAATDDQRTRRSEEMRTQQAISALPVQRRSLVAIAPSMTKAEDVLLGVCGALRSLMGRSQGNGSSRATRMCIDTALILYHRLSPVLCEDLVGQLDTHDLEASKRLLTMLANPTASESASGPGPKRA